MRQLIHPSDPLLLLPFIHIQAKGYGLALAALVAFQLDPQGSLDPNPDFLQGPFFDLLAAQGATDPGWPKAHGEWLAFGKAHFQQPVSSSWVRIQVGNRSKRLLLQGERSLGPHGLSDPIPFTELPLDWAHTYGGPNYPENPQGRGFGTASGKAPCILGETGSLKEAVSFGALPPDGPQRMKFLGKVDAAWLRSTWPCLPQDTHPAFFQTTAPDQWLPDYFKGDEALLLENLHPSHSRLSSALPGIRVRAFLDQPHHGGFQEIPLRCETLFLFPEELKGVLLFRGLHPIKEEDARDVRLILAALEKLEEPCGKLEEYRKRMELWDEAPREALPKEAQAEEKLLSPEPLPAAPLHPLPGPFEDPEWQAAMGELERIQAQVEAQNPLPSFPPSPPRPPVEELSFEKALARLEKMQETLESELVVKASDSPVERLPEAPSVEWAPLLALLKTQQPDFAPELDATNKVLEELEALGQKPEARPQMPVESESHPMEHPPILEDWSGRDFSGQDLRGQDFSHRILEKACFFKAKLDRAHFSGALLAEADFREASLVEAYLVGVQAQNCRMDGADLENADLREADFSGASAEQARFSHAHLEGTLFSKANLAGSQFREARAEGCDFSGSNLQGCQAHKAHLEGADLSDCCLDMAHLDHVQGASLRLLGAHGEAVNFHSAQLPGVRMDESTHLSSSDFREAHLSAASLEGAVLSKSHFCNAELGSANLIRTDLQGADLRGIRAREIRLDHAALQKARLEGADLFHASLRGAQLQGADLRESNLFASDLFRADLSQACLEGAWTGRTLLELKP